MPNPDRSLRSPVGYKYQDFYIPDRMCGAIIRYVEHGLKPGSFLQAVIQNNLSNACAFGDYENIKNLPAYAHFFYNEVPGDCWGSKDKMNAWIKRFEEVD